MAPGGGIIYSVALPFVPPSTGSHPMDYKDLCANPFLQDLPFKIELNEYGTIMMTPASNRHAMLQVEIAGLIRERMKSGRAASECSIDTSKGVKVADVAWVSPEFLAEHGMGEWLPKTSWTRFGFPLNYNSDVLETMVALATAGVADVAATGISAVSANRTREDLAIWLNMRSSPWMPFVPSYSESILMSRMYCSAG